jgi:hypothetical protein
MAERKIMHTIFGKKNMFEIVRDGSSFYVYKTGTKIDGPYGDLRKAVDRAEKEAKREG